MHIKQPAKFVSPARYTVMFWGGMAILALLAAQNAHAADTRQNQSAGASWHFSATLYGYLPQVSGETVFPGGKAGPSFTIDQHKILSNLKFAFMGIFRARKGRWGVLGDLFHANLGDSVKGTHRFRLPGKPPIDAQANLDLDSKTTLLTLAGTYALVDTPRNTLSLVFGTRMIHTRQRLDWKLVGTIPGVGSNNRTGRTTVDDTHWDAIAGVSGRFRFGGERHWFLPYYVDAGGGSSDLTVQAMTGIGYVFGWGEIALSWRYIHYKFKSGSPVSSLSFNGPALGVIFRF